MFRITSRETTSGAIFDAGATNRVMFRMSNEIEQEVAREGYRDIQIHLGQVLKHPTGYYQSSIKVKHIGDDVEVDGDDVIYGPWLEGVGSKNQTTRFKGYFTFRKVAQALEAKSGRIGERIADRETRRL